MAFNSTTLELSFTASGESGTSGYAKITIEKSLIANASNVVVSLDGNPLNYSLADAGDSWVLSFTYSHSTHQLSVYLPVKLTEPIEPAETVGSIQRSHEPQAAASPSISIPETYTHDDALPIKPAVDESFSYILIGICLMLALTPLVGLMMYKKTTPSTLT